MKHKYEVELIAMQHKVVEAKSEEEAKERGQYMIDNRLVSFDDVYSVEVGDAKLITCIKCEEPVNECKCGK